MDKKSTQSSTMSCYSFSLVSELCLNVLFSYHCDWYINCTMGLKNCGIGRRLLGSSYDFKPHEHKTAIKK